MAGKPKFLYALYQGEELLCTGTMKELSDYTKQDIATLRQYLTPSYRKARPNINKFKHIEKIGLLSELEED